jgi:AcrR family transcriptional regulator
METERKSERTKRYIIQQTADIFNRKGFSGTSMSDLTEATGLTKGSIYGNFTNKDEVALAVFDYNFSQISQYISDRMLAKDNSIERLLVYPEIYRRFLEIPFLKSGCPLLNTATEADDTHPMLRQKAQKALSYWKKSIANQVERGKARGEIMPETNADQVAVIISSLIEGAIMQAKLNQRANDLCIAMDFLESYILQLKT